MMSPHLPLPPRHVGRLLEWVLPDDVVGRSILGDLAEEFRIRSGAGPTQARWWYRREAVGIIGRRLLGAVAPAERRVAARARIKGRERREGDPMWQIISRDARYSIRALLRAPRFTVVAVFTLALGIGANTAIFSTVDGVLLEPLPYPDSDRIVGVWHGAPDLGYDQFGTSPGIFHEYWTQNQVFEEMGLFNFFQANLTEDAQAERVDAAGTNHTFFDVLGVRPFLGRAYGAEDDRPDQPGVAVLSHALWQRRYGGSRDVLGRTMRVNGEAVEIIGVMPPSVEFGPSSSPAELWMPLRMDLGTASPGAFSFNAIARLAPDITPELAEAQMAALLPRVRERWADAESFINFLDAGGFHPIVHTLHEETVGDLERPLWILLGTVGFVLLIACANVANLFLVRAEGRQREMAVRAALGATRATLVRQFLTESLLLAAAGGLAGLTLAWMATPVLLGLAPPELPRLGEVSIDGGVLAFTAGVTGLAALLFGVAPALRYRMAGLLGMLRYAGRGTTEGRERHGLRNTLVVGQTALAMVLLVGSGLLVKSFREIRQADPGFDTRGILTVRLSLDEAEYPGATQPAAFYQQLLERIRGLPGVEHAGGVTNLPLDNYAAGTAHDIEDFPTGPGELPPIFWYKFATPDYFDAMGIALVSGRAFERADHEQGLGSIVVSQAIADRYWPDGEALGRRIRFANDTADPAWGTIVGVVESVRDRGLREEPADIVYRPLVSPGGDEGWTVRDLTLVVRAEEPTALADGIRRIVREMNPNLPLAQVRTMETVVANSVVHLSFTALALGIAAFMALILGAVGLYGVLAYVVSQRTQEIGVRMALGAQKGQVQGMVVASGARLAGLGLVLGLAGAAGLTRLLQGLLYGTEPLDPLTFAGTSLVLLTVGLMASYLPARRAAAVDPVASMRSE
jgi:predicted permease